MAISDDFYYGVISALDVVYSHDGPTAVLPVGIVGTIDAQELLRVAEADDCYNLAKRT